MPTTEGLILTLIRDQGSGIRDRRSGGEVAISDPHGNVQMQEFLLSLVRDPRFAAAAPDIVVETLSARSRT